MTLGLPPRRARLHNVSSLLRAASQEIVRLGRHRTKKYAAGDGENDHDGDVHHGSKEEN